jgi:hypothetical protein
MLTSLYGILLLPFDCIWSQRGRCLQIVFQIADLMGILGISATAYLLAPSNMEKFMEN